MSIINSNLTLAGLEWFQVEDLHPDNYVRSIFMTKDYIKWVHSMPYEYPDTNHKVGPYEQIIMCMEKFSRGSKMEHKGLYGELKNLCKKRFIWELKTADVRMFGYFFRPRCMILTGGAMRRDLKPVSKYGPYIGKAYSVLEGLNVEPPKCVEGVNINDVI